MPPSRRTAVAALPPPIGRGALPAVGQCGWSLAVGKGTEGGRAEARPDRWRRSEQFDRHLRQPADALFGAQGGQLQGSQLADNRVLAVGPPDELELPHGIAGTEQVVRVVRDQMPTTALTRAERDEGATEGDAWAVFGTREPGVRPVGH